MSRQVALFSFKSRLKIGASHLKSHLKEKRPLDSKKPLHLILRSDMAVGEYSFLRRAKGLRNFIYAKAAESRVEILDFANAGNHLHIILSFPHRRNFQKFFRVIAGVIPRRILKAEKNSAKGVRFWTGVAFTRIVNFGSDLRGLHKYFELNRIEVNCRLEREAARALLVNLDQRLSPWAPS